MKRSMSSQYLTLVVIMYRLGLGFQIACLFCCNFCHISALVAKPYPDSNALITLVQPFKTCLIFIRTYENINFPELPSPIITQKFTPIIKSYSLLKGSQATGPHPPPPPPLNDRIVWIPFDLYNYNTLNLSAGRSSNHFVNEGPKISFKSRCVCLNSRSWSLSSRPYNGLILIDLLIPQTPMYITSYPLSSQYTYQAMTHEIPLPTFPQLNILVQLSLSSPEDQTNYLSKWVHLSCGLLNAWGPPKKFSVLFLFVQVVHEKSPVFDESVKLIQINLINMDDFSMKNIEINQWKIATFENFTYFQKVYRESHDNWKLSKDPVSTLKFDGKILHFLLKCNSEVAMLIL